MKVFNYISALVCALAIYPADAATFTVTQTSCGGGAGSLSQAVRDANASPGQDIIEISAGLTLQADCDMGTGAYNDESGLLVTESLIIRGNGTVIHGSNAYIENSSGNVNTLFTNDLCPRTTTGYLPAGVSGSLIQVGQRNLDNTGVELILENIRVDNVSELANVRDEAKITLRNVQANNIRDLQLCSRAVVSAYDDADVTLENVTIEGATDFRTVAPNAVIAGNTGKLEVYNSIFRENPSNYALAWFGEADIVSSRFLDSGGLWIGGSESTDVINSLFVPASAAINGRRYTDGFLKTDAGTLTFDASTVVYQLNNCPDLPSLDCNWNGGESSLAAFQARGGTIAFRHSAIHVQSIGAVWNPDSTLLLEELGGDIIADALTFIQPVDWQDATDLQTLTNQPALITGPDALPVDPLTLAYNTLSYPDSVTPILTGGAVLVDRISDAQAGGVNELRDGRGATITEDVFGAPRVIGSLRNIGAVQNDLVPGLLALIEASNPYTALLFWNTPRSTGITGYDLCQGTGAPPTGVEGTLNPCPGTLTSAYTSTASDTTGTVGNLPPNNETHWFAIRAVAGANPEPWSNVQSVVVPVTIGYPQTFTVGKNTRITPTITGPLNVGQYSLLSGSLPTGITLNPTTGEISGDLGGACTSGPLTILVVSASGALTSTATRLICPAAVPTMPGPTLTILLGLVVLLAGWFVVADQRRIALQKNGSYRVLTKGS